MAVPFFSILMPTHLRAALLRRALQSLQAQTFQDFELILVADAWDCESATVAAELLRDVDCFVKRSGKSGPALSRNEGLVRARGEWVIFLDDDDSFAPHHLAAVHARTQASSWPVLFTDCEVVTEDRTQPGMPALSRQKVELAQHDLRSLWVKNFIPNHALAYRRTLLDGLSFDPHMASLEDWEFLLGVCSRSMPRHFAGGGVVIHKDVNPGTSRGTQESSKDITVVLDYIYAYRRWPAPEPELQAQRNALLAGVGLALPLLWF